jgi:hypothetical protein
LYDDLSDDDDLTADAAVPEADNCRSESSSSLSEVYKRIFGSEFAGAHDAANETIVALLSFMSSDMLCMA